MRTRTRRWAAGHRAGLQDRTAASGGGPGGTRRDRRRGAWRCRSRAEERLPDEVTSPATGPGHTEVSSIPTNRREEIVPWPSRPNAQDGYADDRAPRSPILDLPASTVPARPLAGRATSRSRAGGRVGNRIRDDQRVRDRTEPVLAIRKGNERSPSWSDPFGPTRHWGPYPVPSFDPVPSLRRGCFNAVAWAYPRPHRSTGGRRRGSTWDATPSGLPVPERYTDVHESSM